MPKLVSHDSILKGLLGWHINQLEDMKIELRRTKIKKHDYDSICEKIKELKEEMTKCRNKI